MEYKDLDLYLARKTIKQDDKSLDESFAEKVKWGAISATAALAAKAVHSILSKKPKQLLSKDTLNILKASKVPLTGAGLGGLVLGWNLPKLHNQNLKYIQGKVDKADAAEDYAAVIDRSETIDNRYNKAFGKEAGLLSTKAIKAGFGRLKSGLSYAARGAPKLVDDAVNPEKYRYGFGRKAGIGLMGAGVIGNSLGTAGAGKVESIYNKRKTLSGNNYNTFLRNNVLAGNVKQNQLSQTDMLGIKSIGMR